MVGCSAWNCSNRKFAKCGKSFHRFPKNENRRKEWIAALRRKNFQATNYSRVCADHFEEWCFDRTGQTTRLRDTAVPTIFDFPPHLQNKIRKHRKTPGGNDIMTEPLTYPFSTQQSTSGTVVDRNEINGHQPGTNVSNQRTSQNLRVTTASGQ